MESGLLYNYVKANGMITSQQVIDIITISTLQVASAALISEELRYR